VASRRAADQLVSAGRVEVNGLPVALGTEVDPERDRVTVDGRPLPPPLPRRTLILNKPAGVVTTRRDPQDRVTVLDLVDDAAGLVPVGRLDVRSRGLLLLSSDGELTFRLTHPRYGVLKTYRVTVRGRVRGSLLRRLRAGVQLDDGPARPRAVEVVAGRGSDDVLEVVMGEGRWREVRRLCEAVGLDVVDLCRTALGPLQLGRLREGASRPLSHAEAARLYAAVGLAPPR
jgi:23S rRNA pseudouridine2605 synthase